MGRIGPHVFARTGSDLHCLIQPITPLQREGPTRMKGSASWLTVTTSVRIETGLAGFTALMALIGEHTDDPQAVPVAIETASSAGAATLETRPSRGLGSAS